MEDVRKSDMYGSVSSLLQVLNCELFPFRFSLSVMIEDDSKLTGTLIVSIYLFVSR